MSAKKTDLLKRKTLRKLVFGRYGRAFQGAGCLWCYALLEDPPRIREDAKGRGGAVGEGTGEIMYLSGAKALRTIGAAALQAKGRRLRQRLAQSARTKPAGTGSWLLVETQAAIGLAAPRGERTREQDKKRHAKVTRADNTQCGMGRASGGEAGLRASAACPRPCAACNKHTMAWSTYRMAMGEAAAAGTMSAREMDASFASWDICRHACRRMRPSAQRELATSQARRGSTNSGQAGSPGCCVPEAALIFAGRCAVHPAQGCRRSAVAARARPRRREGPACRPAECCSIYVLRRAA